MNILKKARKKEKLSFDITDIIALSEMMQALIVIDLAEKYIWLINNIDINATKKQRLTSTKKYWKCIG